MTRSSTAVLLSLKTLTTTFKVNLLPVLQVQQVKWTRMVVKRVEYTRRQQVSPTRKRGRLPVPGRTKLKGRTSLAEILAASRVEIAQILIKNGFCSENPAAGTCACQSPKWKLEPRGGACNWRCKACRKTAALTTVDLDLFGGQLPLRAIAGALWLYTSKLHLSPDDCSLLLGVDHRAIRTIFEAFNQYFVPIIDQLNDAIVVGGCSADVELDEISFRSTGRARNCLAQVLGSCTARIKFGLVEAFGLPHYSEDQGGGGSISVEEMWSALLLHSDEPILAKGSVCHTDGAKAYRWLSSPLNDGTLVDAAGLKLSHTCVKHKPPHPEFSKKMRVQVWVGDHYEEQLRVGGTQKIDGFFREFPTRCWKTPLQHCRPFL